ncbi:SKP1-like protein 1B [Linum grandiflorum]
MSTARKFTLKSSDGKLFHVEEVVAMESETIKYLVDDGCADDDKEIPITNVTGETLALIIEYCKKHTAPPDEDAENDANVDITSFFDFVYRNTTDTHLEQLKKWDADFMRVDMTTLFNIFMAANYLNIKGLLDLVSQTVAEHIKGKTPEQIRKNFGIENDFSPEEEARIRSENQWAFE